VKKAQTTICIEKKEPARRKYTSKNCMGQRLLGTLATEAGWRSAHIEGKKKHMHKPKEKG